MKSKSSIFQYFQYGMATLSKYDKQQKTQDNEDPIVEISYSKAEFENKQKIIGTLVSVIKDRDCFLNP